DCVHWLPFRQFFMPSPIVPRNVSRMDCCTQFLFRERPECLAVFGNVNRVFQTWCNSLFERHNLSLSLERLFIVFRNLLSRQSRSAQILLVLLLPSFGNGKSQTLFK